MPDLSDVVVARQPERSRYVITAGGVAAGLAQYHEENGAIVVTHTEIAPALGGRGLGSRLVAHVLDDARRRGFGVVPACPFVRDYIATHPEDAGLVPESRRAACGL